MVQGSSQPIPVGQSADDEELLAFVSQGTNKKLNATQRSRLVLNGRKLVPSIYDATRCPEEGHGGHLVRAKCRGSVAGTHYDLCLKLTEKLTVSHLSCTCPYFKKAEACICKHSIALVIWTCKALEEEEAAAVAAAEKEESEEGRRKEPAGGDGDGGGGGGDDDDDESMDGFFDDWLGPSKTTQQASQKAPVQKSLDETSAKASKKRQAPSPEPCSLIVEDDELPLKHVTPSDEEDGWRTRDLGNKKMKTSSEEAANNKGKKPKVSFKAKFIRLGFKLDA